MGMRHWWSQMARRWGFARSPASGDDRYGTRTPCLIASHFSRAGSDESVVIRNLNASGAFIETRKPFCVGDVVHLTFPLHYLDPPIEVTGVIAWTGSDGVGVTFTTIGTPRYRVV